MTDFTAPNGEISLDALRYHGLADYSDPADAEPCIDCPALLLLSDEAYAVDGAVVCPSCARRRYGDRAPEYLIA